MVEIFGRKFLVGKFESKFVVGNFWLEHFWSVENLGRKILVAKFWLEIFRILKPQAKAIIEVPDLEWICKQFLDAEDGFYEFYKVGSRDHYFGNGKSIEHRWGLLTTAFFGNQNGDGQFHYNGYTKQKLIDIHKKVYFFN